MNYTEEKTWDHLQPDEQVVLSLIHAQDMPLASVAKIVSKRTYQVRKINYQAIKIYRLFYKFYEEDPNKELEMPGASILVSTFLLAALEGNRPPSEIRLEISKKYDTTNSLISSETVIYLHELRVLHPDLLVLLQEIDRYRKRFLPKEFQWPSPYRRKRNRAIKRLGDKIWQYDSYLLHVDYGRAKNRVYIPYCFQEKHTAITLPFTPTVQRVLEETLEFPYFKEKEDAEYLAEIITNYHNVKRKSSTIGGNYVYQLRLTLEKAENYKQLFKIPTDIDIDKAFIENDRQLKQLLDKQSKKIGKGAKRADESIF